ncbi:UNVERIFIED_CONTAM: hypothetical protein FKN15_006174 [Acipenser sinensis]
MSALAVSGMLQCSYRAWESTKELVRLLPMRPPPVRRPAPNWRPRFQQPERQAQPAPVKARGDKVQEKIESVIGRELPPQAEDRKRMPYMDAVLHEIQRVGNVVPMNLLHKTTGDTTFRGYKIPKGTPVIPLLSSVLSDKTQWETPHQFNHFPDAQGKFVKRDAFMPFSAGQCVREEQGPGRRVCLGETLAKMALFLFFTMLLQKFHFPPPLASPPDPSPSNCAP